MHVEIWHGIQQRVGHLGNAQDDFNLLGQVSTSATLQRLVYSLNGGSEIELNIGSAAHGFGDTRRLARSGHFNADIAIKELREGDNEVVVRATDADGHMHAQTVRIEKLQGDCPLPFVIDWSEVENPQDIGQYVDGHWTQEACGLRTQHTGYDRLFLLGNRSWRDYVVTASVTINAIDPLTGPISGENGLGLVMRFAGHAVGGHRDFPAAQPKWGYQPFGAIAWLRWYDGPDMPPQKQFYRGDNDERQNFASFYVEEGRTYGIKAACKTLGADVTRYSCKIWNDAEVEPLDWDWQVSQTSQHALRQGGVALVAHHINATFGPVHVEDLT